MVLPVALDILSSVTRGELSRAEAKADLLALVPDICTELVPPELRLKFSECVAIVLDRLVAEIVESETAKIELFALVGAALKEDATMLNAICPARPHSDMLRKAEMHAQGGEAN